MLKDSAQSPSSDSDEEQDHDIIPPEWSPVFDGVEEAISRLNKLGIAIRQSSRSTALAQARKYAAKHLDLDTFEEIVSLALQSLYPNASDSLRDQLGNTMTDRYAKLQYEAYRMGIPDTHHAPKGKTNMKDRSLTTDAKPPPSMPILAGLSPKVQGPAQNPADHNQALPKYKTALSSIDTNILRKNLGVDLPSVARSTVTLSVYQADDRAHEPPPPKFEDGKDQTTCEWCHEVISRSLTEGHKWKNRWRSVLPLGDV